MLFTNKILRIREEILREYSEVLMIKIYKFFLRYKKWKHDASNIKRYYISKRF